jgi:hypothetical protein
MAEHAAQIAADEQIRQEFGVQSPETCPFAEGGHQLSKNAGWHADAFFGWKIA